jgi:SdrD B-like domain
MGTDSTRIRLRPRLEALEPRWQPAAPVDPTYLATFGDAVTRDNEFVSTDGYRFWTIDAGPDQYQNDSYERPTAQTYQVRQSRDGTEQFASAEYFANLDIVEARAGFDDTFLYVSIRMAGLGEHSSNGAIATKGLVYRYGFRLALEEDGGGGLLVTASQPALQNKPPTRYGSLSTFIHRDFNGDVGGTGRSVTKQDRLAEVGGNGYERVVASDGRKVSGERVLWVRISPTDHTVVEFALKYRSVGLTKANLASLPYLEFEANKGLKDPANYLWNDEYTKSEAGSPYRAATGDLSEFGTQGLGNIYELDTLSGGPLAPPQAGEGSLSGFVFVDENLNGLVDEGEGIPAVPIFLSWTDEFGVSSELDITTGDDGSYIFTDLAPGVYTIMEVQPSPWFDGPDFLGSLGGVQEDNDQFDGIPLDAGEFGVNYNFTEFFGE